ncbi:MAG: sodium:glutamate symporter [Clostridia bacterium]|nr:sodium:glutamate symporter [Clostridia bacterium]
MNNNWTLVLDVCLLSAFLGIGTFLKRKVPFFKKFLIPNAIIAGFVGLLVGPQVLNLVPKGALLGENLEQLVYHAMAIGFIALALKERTREKGTEITNTGIGIVSTYLMQAILGFAITLFMAFTFLPDLFPSFGLLLPLGFGQGPGQASSIGGQWALVTNPAGVPGIVGGANIGLSIAAIGFLWACIGGVPLINYFVRKKGYKAEKFDEADAESHMIEERDRPDDIPLSESIDRLTVQAFLIGIVYLFTYLIIKGASLLLEGLGTMGNTVANLLWGFHFIIGAMIAILVRIIFDKMKQKKIMSRSYPNNFLLQRIAGASFDYMITAGITAISITILGKYWIPTIVITSLGMIATMLYVYHLCKRIYSSHVIESTVALYGMLTGTISTGLALLREVDPNFRTPVAKHLVLGSGVGLLFGFPLLILLGVPITGYALGNNMYYLYTMIGFIVYFIALLFLMRLNKRRELRKEGKLK